MDNRHMNGPHLILEGFNDVSVPERRVFSYEPLLNLREAFDQVKRTVPSTGSVTMIEDKNNVAVCVRPFAGHDEPMISYQLSAPTHSVIIRRLHAGETKQNGMGTSLIASQFAFWSRMGVEIVSVYGHDMSQGFYEKLGFRKVDALPEYPPHMNQVLTPMRLFLNDPRQRQVFDAARQQARPLTDYTFVL